MDHPPPLPRLKRPMMAQKDAFSLVEVTLAIGIVVFAMLPLVGLLSVGLNSYSNSNLRGPAVQVVNQIASCVQHATVEVDTSGKPTGDYTAAAPLGATVKWKFNGQTASYPIYFDEDGNLAANSGKPPRLSAMLVLTPPSRAGSAFNPGTAQIAVAWPALAPATNNGGTISFSNPQGHEDTTILFGSSSP